MGFPDSRMLTDNGFVSLVAPLALVGDTYALYNKHQNGLFPRSCAPQLIKRTSVDDVSAPQAGEGGGGVKTGFHVSNSDEQHLC
jgi:hypothetical protein